MNRILKIIFFSLFLNYIHPILAYNKVYINPIDTIETRSITDYGIIFHVNKITISFSIDQIVNSLDSLIKNIDNNNDNSNIYNSYLRLNRQIRSAKQFDIVYDDDGVFISKSMDSKLDSMGIYLLHDLCSDLIDCGYCRILNNGKIFKSIIKANVYVINKYSSTTYVKYFLKGKKYIWTGLPVIHDDLDL